MAVGFEITTNLKAYRQLPGSKPGKKHLVLAKLPKETCLYGGRNSPEGWSLETDGEDIELVIEPPFEETDGGYLRMKQVFRDMMLYFEDLEKVIQRDKITEMISGDPKRKYSRFFNNGLAQGFVIKMPPPKPQQKTAQAITGSPQATVGVRLGRMRALFEEMSRLGENSLFEQNDIKWYTNRANDAARAASNAKALPLNPVSGVGVPASERLKGMLTLLAEYLLMGGSTAQPRAYVKYMTYVMARTDFAKMFTLLPIRERNYFEDPTDTTQQRWVDYVLDAVGKPATQGQRLVESGITDGVMLPHQAVNIPLTRGDWLSGMAKGRNALDRFTMAATSADAAYQDVSGGHRLRALGQLGANTDSVAGGQKEGIVIEFRTLRTAIPWREWPKLANRVFLYTRQLNESKKTDAKPILPGWKQGDWL